MKPATDNQQGMVPTILIMLLVLMFLWVSDSDYEIQQRENQHWCDMVAEGTWFASQDEYELRCGQ